MNKQIFHSQIINLLAVLIMLANTASFSHVIAQTETPVPTEENMEENRAQIEELKERLATKVAELRKLVKRAVYGKIISVSLTSATVDMDTKQVKIELTDDVRIAQVVRGKRTELTIDDLATDDIVTIFGHHDDTLDLLQAKFIFIEHTSALIRESGTVESIDNKANTLSIRTKEGRNIVVDVERSTITSAWTKQDGIKKSGFSKIRQGVTVHLRGTPAETDINRISASRILDLGYLTGNSPSPTPDITPTLESSASAETE